MDNIDNPYKNHRGLKHFWNALRHSRDGLVTTYKNESAFRQEVGLGLVLIIIAMLIPSTALAKACLIGSILLVLIVELLNTAIEAVVDRVSLDQHTLAKRAKDAGSAAVFVSLVNCAVVWALVLFNQFP